MSRTSRIGVCVVILIATVFTFFSKHSSKNIVEAPSFKIESCEQFQYVLPHMSYKELVVTMKEWESKAPDLIEVGIFGKTSDGTEQYYMRICNEKKPSNKKVLVTACIHGNEPWSTSTVMAYAGSLVVSYGREAEITNLVDERVVYFVPVVCPDSYPSSRSSEGLDPNRSFPTQREGESKVSAVRNLQDFFLDIRPNSVLSGHTYGRLYLIPWGDRKSDNPNLSDYERIASEMSELSGYSYKRACDMYNKPIHGTEIDWYHKNGAFAMVSEFGTHQRKPSIKDTEFEFNKTHRAFLYFVRESVNVNVVEKCANPNSQISIRVLVLKHSKEKMADDDAKMVMDSINKACANNLDVKTIGDHWINEVKKIRVSVVEYDEMSNLKEFVSERLSVGARPRDTVIIFTVGHGSPSGYLHNIGSRTEMQKALAEAAEENNQKVLWWQLSCYAAANLPLLGSLEPNQRSLFSVLNTSDSKTPSPAYIEAGIMEKLFSGMINSDSELDRDHNMEITGLEFASYMNSIKRGRGDLLRMYDIHAPLFGLSKANQIPIVGEGVLSIIPTPSRR
jgi:hypothetical protein